MTDKTEDDVQAWDATMQCMTLRDYLAAKAMAAYLVSSATPEAAENPDTCAMWAYQQADAMLRVRASK